MIGSMDRTVKQAANELNRSKSTLEYHLRFLEDLDNSERYIKRTENGKRYITEEGFNIIRSRIEQASIERTNKGADGQKKKDEQSQECDSNSSKTSQNEPKKNELQTIKTLTGLSYLLSEQLKEKDKQLEAKDRQLEEKDRQLEAKDKQIESLMRLLEQREENDPLSQPDRTEPEAHKGFFWRMTHKK